MTENNCSESYEDYLAKAAQACESGDRVLGMHLYLAAYEKAVADPDIADGMELAGLRKAWNLACDLKERSMAEYVFEKLEPYLTGDEIAECANELQNLALDRLAEYGFSREELEGMAEMISQDLIDGEGSIVKVESISIPSVRALEGKSASDSAADADQEPADASVPEAPKRSKELGMGVAPADFNPYDMYDTSSVGKSYHAATNDGSDSYVFTRDADRAAQSERARIEAENVEPEPAALEPSAPVAAPEPAQPEPVAPVAKRPDTAIAPTANAEVARNGQPPAPGAPKASSQVLNYRTLAGYDETVSVMRDFGFGLQRDPGFRNFISMMNARHGLDRMPAHDTMLFRSPIIEDATRFVDATIGELGLPVLRMSMEEGAQGMPVLCVTTQGDSRPRMNHSHNRFDGPGILVLDDLDMWAMPQPPEGAEGFASFIMANMSRGAREAVNLIRSAVEDPDVYVLVTATTQGDPDPFFYELLEPISIIDIPYPTENEREGIWDEILRDHPSMSSLNRADLLRFSKGLPRYDIYMAARAAVEDAYKTGLVQRMFVPVTEENMFDKLAACHVVDSDEYRAIEETVARNFRDELDDIENLLDGPRE